MVLFEGFFWMKSWLSGIGFTKEHCCFSLLFGVTVIIVFGMAMGSFFNKVKLSVSMLSLVNTSYSAGMMMIYKILVFFHQLKNNVFPEVEMSHVKQELERVHYTNFH